MGAFIKYQLSGRKRVSTTAVGHRLIIRQASVWQSIVKFIAS
jgi:hypothetical protein